MAALHCFSNTYAEARSKFIEAARACGAELHCLAVAEDASERYTMDVAVVRGALGAEGGGRLLVVSSGTHGVEGYAGSAIQIRLLEKLRDEPTELTLVLVHAVNPFGMAHFRRWNENNVDLNRNALHPHQFRQLVEKDRLNATYMRFDSVFNPAWVPSSFYVNVGVWFAVGMCLLCYGLRAMKTALVAATYTRPRGVFFGGRELQSSHSLLREFMTSQFRDIPASRVTWLDIHTGLGPCGVDVLLGDHYDAEEMAKLFPAIPGEFDGFQGGFGRSTDDIIASRCGEAEQASGHSSRWSAVNQQAGYEFSVGILGRHEWLSQFFKPDSGRCLAVTQEFGTLSNVIVARALMLENAGFHYDRSNHERWRSFSRDAFYVRSEYWKMRVLKRGEEVFKMLVCRSLRSS